MAWRPCWMTKQNVLSSNMAATPLSFGSPGIGCKPRMGYSASTIDRVFSHDVTTAILVSQNNETAAMLLSQTNPVGVELFSYVKTFFCSNKFAWLLPTGMKTLCRRYFYLMRETLYPIGYERSLSNRLRTWSHPRRNHILCRFYL